jgi:hypothetical protein
VRLLDMPQMKNSSVTRTKGNIRPGGMRWERSSILERGVERFEGLVGAVCMLAFVHEPVSGGRTELAVVVDLDVNFVNFPGAADHSASRGAASFHRNDGAYEVLNRELVAVKGVEVGTAHTDHLNLEKNFAVGPVVRGDVCDSDRAGTFQTHCFQLRISSSQLKVSTQRNAIVRCSDG